MVQQVEFYFDYVSPYAYLSQTQFAKLGLDIVFRPISILDVMAAVNNQPSPKCPNKLRHALRDTQRWAERYGVPFQANAAWLAALEAGKADLRLYAKGALAALDQGCLPTYHRVLSSAIWAEPKPCATQVECETLLGAAGVPAQAVFAAANRPGMDARLNAANEAAAAVGVFGVPTFCVAGELFFGNDRLDWVQEWANKPVPRRAA